MHYYYLLSVGYQSTKLNSLPSWRNRTFEMLNPRIVHTDNYVGDRGQPQGQSTQLWVALVYSHFWEQPNAIPVRPFRTPAMRGKWERRLVHLFCSPSWFSSLSVFSCLSSAYDQSHTLVSAFIFLKNRWEFPSFCPML